MNVKLLAITPNAEALLEEAGRTCYLSFEKKAKDSFKRFIRMIIKNGHLSVLEHAYATFRITGGSRSFTHQIVRHRLCSFSQQSQRYVNEKNFSVVTPRSIESNPEAYAIYINTIEKTRRAYADLQKIGIRNEDARFILPNAVESEIVISANFRELRHIFEERCSIQAQWEIRRIAIDMLKIMKKESPIVFEDFTIDEEKMTASN